jgi:spore photoproduct lyase
LVKSASENKIQRRRKRQEAARKAWETIRNKKKLNVPDAKPLFEIGVSKVREPCLESVRTDYGKQIIHRFNKTPSSIACGPFWELRWAFGCPFDCAYCYLRGTSRGKMQPRYINVKYVLQALDYVFEDNQFNEGKPAIFNSGELADSWMNPQIMIQIVQKFEEQSKHKLLTLTKFGIQNQMVDLLTGRLYNQTMVAFSINSTKVAELYEKSASPPISRIEAASRLSDSGYDVRVRIDPIFPIAGWRNHYEDIVYSMFTRFEPNRIILGTPRGLQKTILFAKKANMDLSWVDFLEKKETGWGWKMPFELRLEIYQFFYDKLSALGYPKEKVSLCKENVEMWKAMRLEYTPFTCNCYGKG